MKKIIIDHIAKRPCVFCKKYDYIFQLRDLSIIVVKTRERVTLDDAGGSFKYLRCSYCGHVSELIYNCTSLPWARGNLSYAEEKDGRWYEAD